MICPICAAESVPVVQLTTGTLLKCTLCHWLFTQDVPLKPIVKANLDKEKRDEYLAIVHKASEYSGLSEGERVLDINSGDGMLLGWYLKHTVTVGVEPNVELMKQALKEQRVDVPLMEKFPPAVDIIVRGEVVRFKIITAIDCLQDYANPLETLIKCQTMLADEGVLVIQVPYFPQLYKGDAADFPLDQHYFLTYTLRSAVQRAQLELQGVEIIKSNIRIYATRLGNKKFAVSDFNDKLRLYTTMSTAIINELHARYDLPSKYIELENKLRPRQKPRNDFGPSLPTPT
jgi:hypothetical protein